MIFCTIIPLSNNFFIHQLSLVSECDTSKENTTSGWILSPQYPGYYTNNANYKWHLKAPKGHVIRLEFLYFSLEYDPQCSNDFVRVHYSLSENVNRTFCGQIVPPIIESSGRMIQIIFRSNARVTGGGFKAKYRAIQRK